MFIIKQQKKPITNNNIPIYNEVVNWIKIMANKEFTSREKGMIKSVAKTVYPMYAQAL